MIVSIDLNLLARRLSLRAKLDDADMAALVALPFTRRRIDAKIHLTREGDRSRAYCSLIVSGMAFRYKLTDEGARQIVALHVPGDLLDPHHPYLKLADSSVQAMTAVDLVEIPHAALEELILTRPAVARALWLDGQVEIAIARQWLLNIGRREARTRIAHLLCEIAVRMRASGLVGDLRCDFPMTQEQIGDATGLTSVHVNRTIKSLLANGLIEQHGRRVAIADWAGMTQVGAFDPLYLYLGEFAAEIDAPPSPLYSGARQ